VTNDLTLSEVARAAEFFMSDGVVVTGKETGAPTDSQNVTGELYVLREPQ